MIRAELNTDRSSFSALRALPSSLVPRLSTRGFTYITLLVVLTIVGISLGAAGKYWSNVIVRDKEEELLFRGDQYRQAIQGYYYGRPGLNQYPQSLDDLLSDNRSVTGKRYLRQKFKDPMTNDDFVVIKDPLSNRIMGVRSSSDKTPLKTSGFPDVYRDFEGKLKYSEWEFRSIITATGAGQLPGTSVYPKGVPPPLVIKQSKP